MYVQIVDTRPSSLTFQISLRIILTAKHEKTKEDPEHVNATTEYIYILQSADVGSVWQAVLYSN